MRLLYRTVGGTQPTLGASGMNGVHFSWVVPTGFWNCSARSDRINRLHAEPGWVG
jgi:hypothetical protein